MENGKIIYCKRCRSYNYEKDFYKTKSGHYEHKRKLCKKSKKKKVLWDDFLNPKTIKEMQEWFAKNEEKIKAYSRNMGRICIHKLTDSYVKSILIDAGFTNDDINKYPELIKTKKEIIKTNRL